LVNLRIELLQVSDGARATEHHQANANPEPRSAAAMSDVERLGSICQVLEEQCDAVVARLGNAKTLQADNTRLTAALLEVERERDGALAEVAALKTELAKLQAAEQAARDLLYDQDAALAQIGLSSGFDEAWYLRKYPDVRTAVEQGRLSSGLHHYLIQGHKEQRKPVPPVAAETRRS
jgi:septal ring factor EnvC (AmiA/AmiB activator)